MQLGTAWAQCKKSMGRKKRGSPWLHMHMEAGDTVGMEDLKKNVPLVERALRYGWEICNAPRKLEKEAFWLHFMYCV